MQESDVIRKVGLLFCFINFVEYNIDTEYVHNLLNFQSEHSHVTSTQAKKHMLGPRVC